jgi:hypothetical protein
MAIFLRVLGAREAPAAVMTWDQALVWIIIPVIGGLLIGAGGVWLSKRIP